MENGKVDRGKRDAGPNKYTQLLLQIFPFTWAQTCCTYWKADLFTLLTDKWSSTSISKIPGMPSIIALPDLLLVRVCL